MNQVSNSSEDEGFQALARLTLAQTKSPRGTPPVNSRLVEILAHLLAAAASGKGALLAKDLLLNEEDLRALSEWRLFFSIEHGLLRLPRYSAQAQEIREFYERRHASTERRFDHDSVRTALDAIFPPHRLMSACQTRVTFDNAHQRLSVAGLLDASVGVLTGGPGTGKTTTAAALLAVRKRLEPNLLAEHVLVTAPTGKAACRLGESITKATTRLKNLAPDEERFLRSIRATTLHQALEWGPLPPEKGGPFRRNAARPIEARIILVDEASMVDLSLMHALMCATGPGSALLLLGDSDQLESVEAGGVLAELVRRAAPTQPSAALTRTLSMRLNLPDERVVGDFLSGVPHSDPSPYPALPGLLFGLKFSHRAMNAPWILELAEMVRPGSQFKADDFEACIKANSTHLRWHQQLLNKTRDTLLKEIWEPWAQDSKGWFTSDSDADFTKLREALARLGDFQLLCSTNRQVERANQTGTALLHEVHNSTKDGLPHGCPIIVLKNNHALRLNNGDIGVALSFAPGEPASLAAFQDPSGLPRLLPLAQLPEHSAAFALTIHKSQGSEWQHVAIELPAEHDAAGLSRNLLYTAITRSSARVNLIGSPAVLKRLFAEPR